MLNSNVGGSGFFFGVTPKMNEYVVRIRNVKKNVLIVGYYHV